MRPNASGWLFSFPEQQRQFVLAYLTEREGPSFALNEMEVRLESGTSVTALVPINDKTKGTYMGAQPASARAQLIREARGAKGACLDYLVNIRRKLTDFGVVDPAIELAGIFLAADPSKSRSPVVREAQP